MKIGVLILSAAVAVWPGFGQAVYNPSPTRQFGQVNLDNPVKSFSPNLIEGRELWAPQGVALDTSVSPPIVYVSDTQNNRILAWKNSASFNNGALADKVIGQRDFYSSLSGGPGTNFSSGLSTPTGMAVDSKGNLYVVDSGNNRIIRYPQPFNQSGVVSADLAIGQTSLGTGNSANQGLSVPSASTVFTSSAAGVFRATLAFDSQGNLWFTDGGNNRVLRYPASALSAGGTVSADRVLGQVDFVSNAAPTGTDATRTNKAVTVDPSGIAVAPSGDLYISDGYSRVLYFKNPVSNGVSATRVLGVVIPITNNANSIRVQNGCPATAPQPCEVTLGAVTSANGRIPPEGVAVDPGNHLYVADNGNNRIVVYPTPDKWEPECIPTTAVSCAAGQQFSPTPSAYLAQNGGESVQANQGARNPGPGTLSGPVAVAFAGPDLWIADSGNNRALVYPSAVAPAARVLGQYDFSMAAPDLIEGRELYTFGALATGNIVIGGTSMAVDAKSNPPHLYIADSLNNRVLGFADYRKVQASAGHPIAADIVIGQLDFRHAVANYATNNSALPTDASLYLPTGVAVDASGNLYVADQGNGRVIRFPAPFSQTAPIKANLALGKPNLFTNPGNASDPTPNTMRAPYGIAFTSNGSIAVSDPGLSRILIFKKPAGGDFTTGQAADIVVGQTDFISSGTGGTLTELNGPRGLATDTSDRLYVADTANNRMLIFNGPNGILSYIGSQAIYSQPSSAPHAVAVSPRTGEIWLAETGSQRVTRYPVYDILALNPGQALATIPASYPFAISLDAVDNPIVADATNRILFFFQASVFKNAASYSDRALAPGMLAVVSRGGGLPSDINTGSSGVPFPTTLNDIQVMVNGTLAPVFYTQQNGAVWIQVPYNAPTAGNASVQILRASSAEVLADASLPFDVASPGFFTSNQAGTGQVAALNQDGSVNTPTNPAARGTVIAMYGTGLGAVSGAPPDGQPAPGAVATSTMPRVVMGCCQVDSANVQYFGLAPSLIGGFQLNVKIPDKVAPGTQTLVGMFWDDIPSTAGPGGSRVLTTIAVK